MSISQFPVAAAGGAKEKRIVSFTASGTWTVPAGVTYAIGYAIGGGGGVGNGGGGGGGSTIIAFSSTVTATGGATQQTNGNFDGRHTTRAGTANTGEGGSFGGTHNTTAAGLGAVIGGQGQRITEGSSVTPATGIPITIGAGGAAGTSGTTGGSGYVVIEYYE